MVSIIDLIATILLTCGDFKILDLGKLMTVNKSIAALFLEKNFMKQLFENWSKYARPIERQTCLHLLFRGNFPESGIDFPNWLVMAKIAKELATDPGGNKLPIVSRIVEYVAEPFIDLEVLQMLLEWGARNIAMRVNSTPSGEMNDCEALFIRAVCDQSEKLLEVLKSLLEVRGCDLLKMDFHLISSLLWPGLLVVGTRQL